MLENIKSQYIFRIIIFPLSEKKKLNLVKYNKKLQTKLDIKVLNYKIFSGKSTIIYDNDKKGKIYDEYEDKLIYEGEFSNGEKNGKGKEYGDNKNVIFDGEFLNGQKNGKGKEYYNDGKLKYEGEYHYGYRNGKGKEYYKNGKLKFEGEYLNE